MEEFNGTAGPWVWDDEGLGNTSRLVFGKDYPLEITSKADRAIIAAAPELLEALQDFMANASGEAESCGHSFECVCRFDKAKAAIAKALGK